MHCRDVFSHEDFPVMSEQALAIMRARIKAFRWKKGVSGNPDAQSRFYHETRKLARRAAP